MTPTPTTLAQLARAEIAAHYAYTAAMRLQLDGHRVLDAPHLHVAKLDAVRAWGEAMASTDTALVAAGRAPLGVDAPRGPALEALIQEEASP